MMPKPFLIMQQQPAIWFVVWQSSAHIFRENLFQLALDRTWPPDPHTTQLLA